MLHDKINIAIADDHPIVRKGIIGFINIFDQFEIIIEASDGQELIERIDSSEIKPDICILDISMPNMNGYKALQEIKRNWTAIKVLIFSEFCDEFSVCETLNSGANGYLTKNSSPRQLQQALAAIYYHDFYLTESTSKLLSGKSRRNIFHPKITEREMEFLGHCCSELNYKEIAALMHVSPRTIDAYRDALFTKFNLTTRTGLVIFALQNGIVALPGVVH